MTKGTSDPEAYIRWRKYYPYCAGLLGDLVPHRLLPLMVATGNPEFPTRVTSLGTKNVHADTTVPRHAGARLPEHVEFLGGIPQRPDHDHCRQHGQRPAVPALSFTGTKPRWKSAAAASASN